ncbi:MAG: hypothetical protein GTN86_04680, partial [Xanthomonadales bacterium]|nr:hypothetical protein [Xanthomonadales bacterium]NIN59318.1 hypothetical protein [Xanthomonadales bacterium]NIN74622.1 hypothetical protein [Xanthomonadales bacterium]NIO12572.1 hypothetical protein [Xanthomonadales bacterium]NIP11711.1 hypothetical protein [Xanthomonadales bacterium]
MNWEALGAIGELLGAAGVVISLAYLGVQIRATRETNKKAVLQVPYGKYNDIRQSVIERPELAELFLNGLDHPEALGRNELFRFMAICETLFLNGEELWLLFDKKVEEERISNTMGYLAYFIETPGGKAFWNHPQSQNLTPGFRK